ncbi:MAG: hypothetical protein CMF29_08155 [Kiritimatiellaceae bacterium]|nr:hypothetical protein [Kiritimatiellaceae bacterium]
MKKAIVKPTSNTNHNDTIQTEAEIYLDFAPLLQATSVGEADNGQANPYKFTGYSVAHGYIMRGVYAAKRKAKDYYDSIVEQINQRADKLGGDLEAIASDDLTANLNIRMNQAHIQWACLHTMSLDIQAKYKAVTNEDCQTYEAWLKNSMDWADGKRVTKVVDNSKTARAVEELVADLPQVA